MKAVAFAGDLTEARLNSVWTETYGYRAPFAISDLERRPVESPAVLRTELTRHAGQQVFAG